jgi:hypothetical protein
VQATVALVSGPAWPATSDPLAVATAADQTQPS